MDGSHHLYFSSALAVVVGAVLASLYTFYLNHLSSRNEIIKDFLADLEAIERLCRDYWLVDPKGKLELAQHELVGHELRARIEATSIYRNLTKKILGQEFSKFEELDVTLFMTATGGSFQTSSFKSSPATYSEIMTNIGEIRRLLREKRSSLFWAH